MRKWMRERLQRRKKTPAATPDQPAPPPLQPAYFDAEQSEGASHSEDVAADVPTSSVHEAQPSRGERFEADPQPHTQQPSEQSNDEEANEQGGGTTAAPRSSAAAGRSRRRRGGRGRGGRGREQAVAQAFTPAAVKGSIPVVPVDSSEADFSDAEAAEPEERSPVQPAAAVPAKTAAIPAAAPRAPKGVVVLAIGLPGSGKSSWFKRHNVVPLSSDMVRSLLFDDIREQRFQDLVFSNLRSMLKARLIAKRPMNYVDATNLTPQERQHWIKLAKDYQYEVHAVFFDVPLDVCIERHQRRDRAIPEDVMRRMSAKLKPPAFEEGFAKITVVRVKKKDVAEA